MKKIVITGATSFIGVHLINEWLRHDCDIYVIVRPNSTNISRLPVNSHIHVVELIMDDYDQISSKVQEADYFYHLAWEGARVPYRDDQKIQENNYMCSIKAMHAAHLMGCEFFMGSGSQAEYGKMGDSVTEQTKCVPNTEYGKYKLKTCVELEKLAADYNMRFIWTRIFSIYGKYDYDKTLISSCLKKMSLNESINLTECKQLWDFLYVGDAAKALVKFADTKCKSGIYNLASGDIRPLKDYINEMKEILHSESELNFGAVPYGDLGPIDLRPNIGKLKRELKWSPEIPFSNGILLTIGENVD
jgi:nucleoside-diphosphate-sugar epimerase